MAAGFGGVRRGLEVSGWPWRCLAGFGGVWRCLVASDGLDRATRTLSGRGGSQQVRDARYDTHTCTCTDVRETQPCVALH